MSSHFIFLPALIFICVNHHSWRMKVLRFFFFKNFFKATAVQGHSHFLDTKFRSAHCWVQEKVCKIFRDRPQEAPETPRPQNSSGWRDEHPERFFFSSGICKFWRRSCMQNKSLKTQHWFWIDKVCKWVTNERKIMTLSALSRRLQGEEKVTYR